MVCLSIAPTLCSASIVSWTAAIASLRYLLLISHLYKIDVLDKFLDLFFCYSQHVPHVLLELSHFIGVDIRPVTFGESVSKSRARSPAEEDDRSVAARLAPPRPRDPLLDDASAKVGIHVAALGPRYRVRENGIADSLLSG